MVFSLLSQPIDTMLLVYMLGNVWMTKHTHTHTYTVEPPKYLSAQERKALPPDGWMQSLQQQPNLIKFTSLNFYFIYIYFIFIFLYFFFTLRTSAYSEHIIKYSCALYSVVYLIFWTPRVCDWGGQSNRDTVSIMQSSTLPTWTMTLIINI